MPVRICVPIFSFLPFSVWAQWPWKVSVDSRPSHCPLDPRPFGSIQEWERGENCFPRERIVKECMDFSENLGGGRECLSASVCQFSALSPPRFGRSGRGKSAWIPSRETLRERKKGERARERDRMPGWERGENSYSREHHMKEWMDFSENFRVGRECLSAFVCQFSDLSPPPFGRDGGETWAESPSRVMFEEKRRYECASAGSR